VALIYFEDVVLGKQIRHGPYKVTERDIIDFATQWEPRPHHIVPIAAKETALGGLTAAGPHLVSICYRLCAEVNYLGTDVLAGIAALGMEVKWLQYVRPGDELMLHRVPTEKRLSKSRPGTGIIVHENSLHNQNGDRVFVMNVTALYECRPTSR